MARNHLEFRLLPFLSHCISFPQQSNKPVSTKNDKKVDYEDEKCGTLTAVDVGGDLEVDASVAGHSFITFWD